jgi:hypothetical protein
MAIEIMAFPCQIKTPQGLPAAREIGVEETVKLSGQQAQYDKESMARLYHPARL